MKSWIAELCACVTLALPLVSVGLPGKQAMAHPVHCALGDVSLQASNPADGRAACRGAQDAVAFLARQGLSTNSAVRVKIVDRLPPAATPTSIGIYLPQTKTAYLLRFSKLTGRTRQYDLPLTRRLYQSLATHEITHALTAGMFSQSRPMIFAEEYIAYVAMLDSMPAKDRDRLLAEFPGPGFEQESHINTMTYQFDPLQFGVFCYRHYLRPENGAAFIRRILAGEALAYDMPN